MIDDTTGVYATTASRIYPRVLPQNPTLPAIVLNLISDRPHDDISGNAGLFTAEIQVDIFAETPASAIALSEKVRLLLQAYSGTKLSIVIRGIYLENTTDDFMEEVVNFRQIISFSVWYKRPNP